MDIDNHIPANFNLFLRQTAEACTRVKEGSWNKAFAMDEMIKYYDSFINRTRPYVDFKSIDLDMAKALGFQSWNDSLYLIPLWFMPLVPEDAELISILGDVVKAKDINNDTRSGYVAYGIKF